jgi:hypothetical protein
MQKNFGNLLEEIDKAGKITVGELEKKGFDRGLMELVGKYYDLIRLDSSPAREITDPLNTSDYLIVSPKGFEYLNPIKIKKAIEQLDASIKKFNESSDISSKKMIELTFAIYIFTIIVVALPIYEKIIQLFKISPIYEIIWLIVGVVFIVAFMWVWFYKIYGTSKELK